MLITVLGVTDSSSYVLVCSADLSTNLKSCNIGCAGIPIYYTCDEELHVFLFDVIYCKRTVNILYSLYFLFHDVGKNSCF